MSILDNEGHDRSGLGNPRTEPPPLEPPQANGELRPDLLAQLARLLDNPPVPKIGVEAASAMRRCFETVASDVERLAAEHVRRSTELQQEAQTFAAVVRGAGEKLCHQIEQEALRGFQISKIVTTAQQMMAEPAESGG